MDVTIAGLPGVWRCAPRGDESSLPVSSPTAGALGAGVDTVDAAQVMDSLPTPPRPTAPRVRLNVPREVMQDAATAGVVEGGVVPVVDSVLASHPAATSQEDGGADKTVSLEMPPKCLLKPVFSSPSKAGENNGPVIKVDITAEGVTRTEEVSLHELSLLYAQQQAALHSIRGEFDILYVPDWVHLHPLLGSYVAEAFGTFACVLTLSLVSVRNQSLFNRSDDTNMTALPIGFIFMSMVFTFGYISGGHFNPAVTLAVFLVRKVDAIRALGYVVAQTAASLGAGLVAMAIQGSADIFVPHVDNAYVSSGVFSELIFTFALATVVLNVAYSRQSGNFFYGFAIGMTVAAGSAAAGRISGGAFNPAAATGLQLALCLAGDCDALSLFWVYWLAPLMGAVIAAILFAQISQPEETRVLTDAAVLHNNQSAGNTGSMP